MKGGEVVFDFKGDTKDIDSKISNLKQIIKGTAIGQTIANGVQEATSALANLGKESLNAMADYEQLVGGVDTLFKESSAKVQKYASQAYKTAGISANKYMEQATSFSASLLQSLGGDTEAAADITNMAITDMSDNMNKMGSSMESIQNAYQGFAKQNYTMLDNLKLGYGGTKQEMERLLADAEKLTGVHYDISNLADVYNAIHVIQQNLDITGTTAKEASTTISGSLNMVKASFEDLMSGEGTPEALIESITTAADNVVPAILKLVPNIVNGISAVVSSIIPQIPPLINQLVPVLTKALLDVLGVFVVNLPQFTNAGMQLIIQVIQGIAQALPTLIPQIALAIPQIVQAVIDNLPLLIMAGIDLIVALIEGIINATPQLMEQIPPLIDSLVTALTSPEMLVKIITGAWQICFAIAKGIIEQIPYLITMVPKVIQSIVQSLGNMIHNTNWGALGKQMLNGLINGLLDFGNIIKNAVKRIGNSITGGIKDFFGIHSPSKVMFELGGYVDKGFINGIESMRGDISDVVDGTFDFSPTMLGNANQTFSPETNVNVYNSFKQDPLGQMVNDIKTFSGGSKNDYNYGMGV